MTIYEDKEKKAEFIQRARVALEAMTNSLEDIKSFLSEYAEAKDFWGTDDDPSRPWDSFDTLIEEAVILKRATWKYIESCFYGEREDAGLALFLDGREGQNAGRLS